MNDTFQHIKLLSTFHYVVGGLAALFACFPLLHLIVGIVFIVAARRGNPTDDLPPEIVGWFFVIFATVFILLGWALAICIILAGRCLARQKGYLYCLVMGGIECVFMPLGTVLGVFTLIVLTKPGTKELFTPQRSASP